MKRVSDADLRLLRIFADVVRCKGLSAAQVELNLSVSSISCYISTLEQRLGVRLCNRGRSGFSLTDKGEVIYREAQRLFAFVDEFAMTASEVRGQLSGTLKIGHVDCTVTDANAPITRALHRFNSREHDVRIELSIAPPADLQRRVLDGQLHVAIACFPSEVSRLVTEPLYDEVNSFYCGRRHPLFEKDEVTLDDIHAARVVARSYWRGADLLRLGVHREAASVDIMEAQAMLILSGAYLGYLPQHYAASWVSENRLRCLISGQLSYVAPFSMVIRRGGATPAIVRQFIHDLKESLPSPPTLATDDQRQRPAAAGSTVMSCRSGLRGRSRGH
jgi:LysR family transcriptional regulator, transcriptional activator for bauABCD operon